MHVEDINRLREKQQTEQEAIEEEQTILLKKIDQAIRRLTLTPCKNINNTLKKLLNLINRG